MHYKADVPCRFFAINPEFWLVVRGPKQHLFNPLPYFFHPLLERHATSLRLDQIFQSRVDSCLEGPSGKQDESVYNFLNSDKELPFIILWGLKSTGNSLCPSLLVTLSSYDGDMLLWMRFFTAGEQKIRVAGFIASFKDTSVFPSSVCSFIDSPPDGSLLSCHFLQLLMFLYVTSISGEFMCNQFPAPSVSSP